MMLYNIGSRSAGAFIPAEPDQHYITLGPDQQEIFNHRNRINMML